MAIKQQEKNFLMGIAVLGLLVGLSILVFPMLSSESTGDTNKPKSSSENVRVEVDQPTSVKKAQSKRSIKKPEEPRADTTPPVEPTSAKEYTLVVSKPTKVPSGYFEDNSGTTAIPNVIEKYLSAAKNGSRFMGRLESIALRDNKILEEQRSSAKKAQSLRLERGDTTKVISYNMKIKTPFVSARFDAAAMDDFKGDVLVEWVDSTSNQRIELFFTPVQRDGSNGQFKLKMPEDTVPPASRVFVYSASDDMPLIASGTYDP